MATTKEAAPRFAHRLGLQASEADTAFRWMRQARGDLMLEAGKGSRDRHLSPRHAANALIALPISAPTRVVPVVIRYRALVPGAVETFRTYRDGSILRVSTDRPVTDLFPVAMTETFGDMLDGLIEGAALGVITGDERPFDVEVRVQHGGRSAAEIRFTDCAETFDDQGKAYRLERRVSYAVPNLFSDQRDLTPEHFVVLRHEHIEFAGEIAKASVRQSEIEESTPSTQVSEALAKMVTAAKGTGSPKALPKTRKAARAATPTASKTRDTQRRPKKAAPTNQAQTNQRVANMQVTGRGRLLNSKGDSPDGTHRSSHAA